MAAGPIANAIDQQHHDGAGMEGTRGRIPIAVMTANAFAEDVQLAKNTGMNDHIAKPLDFEKLCKVLSRWL